MGGGLFDNLRSLAKVSPYINPILSRDIIAYAQSKLVAASVFRDVSAFFDGTGNSIKFPRDSVFDAEELKPVDGVVLQNPDTDFCLINIDQKYHAAFGVDVLNAAFLSGAKVVTDTKSAGFAVAKKIDSTILSLAADCDLSVDFTDKTGNDLYDKFLEAILAVDDAEVAPENRAFVIPPILKTRMFKVTWFTSADFTGTKYPVNTGLIGEVLGAPVYVSTNLKYKTESGHKNFSAYYGPRDALAFGYGLSPKVLSGFDIMHVSDIYVALSLWGVEAVKPEEGCEINVLQ